MPIQDTNRYLVCFTWSHGAHYTVTKETIDDVTVIVSAGRREEERREKGAGTKTGVSN